MEDFIFFTHEESTASLLKPCGWNQCIGLRLPTSTAHVSYFINACAFIFSSVHILHIHIAFCIIVEDPFTGLDDIQLSLRWQDWLKGHIMHISCFINECIWIVLRIKTFKWVNFAYIIRQPLHLKTTRPLQWFYHSEPRDFTPVLW